MGKAHSLKTVQFIPASLEEAWEFFSNPANLSLITPEALSFKVISKHHGSFMYAGQIIEYTVRPVLRIPLYWMTEITHVKEKEFFVDEQRFGPYALWHHQHHFKPVEGGVEMTDIVHYKVGYSLLGTIANHLFVRNQLQAIFQHRFKAVAERFGGSAHKDAGIVFC